MFFCKKNWTLPQRRVYYVQYQYCFILHFTYLGGCVCTKCTPCIWAIGPAYNTEEIVNSFV